MTLLKRGHGAPRLPNGAVQEYVVTIDVWIDGQVEWSRVNVPKDRSLLVSAYSGKPLYTPTFSGDGELAAVEQEWLQADRVLKSMEDEARQANPLLTTCKKELDLAKKRAGNLGSSKYKYMHDKEHARERKRTFKRLQTWYCALFLADVLKDKTEPLLTCITYDDYLMSMYVEHIPKTTGIEIDIDPEDNTPKAIWDVFTRTFLANRGVFEKRLSALESASGFPSEILEKAKRDAADDMRIFFYRNYLSVATPKALKKQRGDQNVIGRKVGNAVAKARKANK